MPTKKCVTMLETFREMFPNFKDRIKKYGVAKNGAGILLVLNDGTELQFSYLDHKNWWLKTV